MIALSLRTGLAALAAFAAAVVSGPALANSSATADIAAPLRAAQAAKSSALGSGDDQFRTLFASWQASDTGSTAAPAAKVSIPSLVPLEGYRMTSEYGMRNHPISGGRRAHKGIDLAASTGTPIRAPADGVVERANRFSGYGLYIALEHGGNIETRYGHLSRLNVTAGQRVTKGEVIGYVGSTGNSTGPHLHYEVRIAGEAVNPLPYMQSGEFQQAFASNAVLDGVGGPE